MSAWNRALGAFVALGGLAVAGNAAALESIGNSYDQMIPDGSNQPPKVTVSASTLTVTSGEAISLTTSVRNLESGDSIAYYWESTSGAFGGSAPFSEVTWTAPSVQSGKTFTIECEVGDGHGSVDWDSVTVTVVPPAGPSGDRTSPHVNILSLAGYTFEEGDSITLYWSASDNVGLDHFELYVFDDIAGSWSPLATSLSPSVGQHTWTAAIGFSEMRLLAYDTSGNVTLAESGEFSVEQSYEAVPPATPSLKQLATSTADTHVFNDWDDVPGATGYVLSVAQGSPDNEIAQHTSGISQNAVTGLANGIYFFKVKATNTAGESSWSSTESIVVAADLFPGAITAVAPASGSPGIGTSATLQWQQDAHPGGESTTFDVWFGKSAAYFSSGQRVSVGQTATSFAVSNLEYDTEYQWKIVSHDTTGDERGSSVFAFTTAADVSPPSGTLTINGGAATTDTFTVALNLTGSDAGSGVRHMRASNDGVHFTDWLFFSEIWSAWNLTDRDYGGYSLGESTYTVYVQLKDTEGNVSDVYADTIDKTAGTPGEISLNGVAYETIQDAIDAAVPGDVVQLSEGTYTPTCGVNPPRFPSTTVGPVMADGVVLRGAGAETTSVVVGDGCLYALVDAPGAVMEGITLVNQNSQGRDAVLMASDGSTLRNCIVRDTGRAGVFLYSGSGAEVSSCLIVSNGVGIDNLNAISARIYNNTVVYNNTWGIKGSSDDDIRNNIFAFNGAEGVDVAAGVTFTHNDVYGNSGGNYDTGSGLVDQTGIAGNRSFDPAFVSGSDYRLSSSSLAIDQGTDLGRPFTGSAPDMGAYEFDSSTGSISVSTNVTGASFALAGNGVSAHGGGTSWSQTGLVEGYYSITFHPLDGYAPPNRELLFLAAGDAIDVDVAYVTDVTGPQGTVEVGHAHHVTTVLEVDVVLDFVDNVDNLAAGARMQLSNDGVAWSPEEDFKVAKFDWDLSDYGGSVASGTKVVYARVSDTLGNWSTSVTDTILYAPNRGIHEVPRQYATIQAAVDTAASGDLVLVHEGSYVEDVAMAPGVALQGVAAGAVTLQGTVTCADGALVDGFTFLSGYQGVVAASSDCIISNNRFEGLARGIEIYGTSVGIVRNNLFAACGQGILSLDTPQVRVVNNTFFGSAIGAISNQNGALPERIHIINNIVAGNEKGISSEHGDADHDLLFSSFNLFFSNRLGNYYGERSEQMPGSGDQVADPLFADSAANDFSLGAGSPGLSSGNPLLRYANHDLSVNTRGYEGGRTRNTPPAAKFVWELTSVDLELQFDPATTTDAERPNEDLVARWDFDGDGTFDTGFVGLSALTRSYAAEGDYDVVLEVMDEFGMLSSHTETVTVEIPNNPPNVPSPLNPLDGASGVSAFSELFQWVGSDPDAGDTVTYRLYLGASLEPPLLVSGLNESQYAVASLGHNQLYFWRVVAVDQEGAETSSQTYRFSTEDVTIPLPAGSLVAQALSSTEVALDWVDNSAFEQGFVVERRSAGGAWGEVGRVPEGVTYYRDSLGLSPGAVYEYRVIAYNEAGAANPSLVASVQLDNGAPSIDPAIPDVSTDWNTPLTFDLSYYKNDTTDVGAALGWTLIGFDSTVFGATLVGDSLSLMPTAGVTGSDVVELRLTDSGGLWVSQTVTLQVTAPQTTPEWVNIPPTMVAMGSTAADFLNLWDYVADPGYADSQLTFSVVGGADPACGLTISSGHWLDAAPDATFSGTCVVAIRADNGLNYADTVVTLHVRGDEGSCATPEAIDSFPFEHEYVLSDIADAVDSYGTGCAVGSFGYADVVYSLEVSAGDSYTVEVAPDASVDVAIQVLESCASGQTCVDAADGFGPGHGESLQLLIREDTTYWIIVEGLFSAGAYTITVNDEGGFCEIAGATYLTGDRNPDEDCQLCDPALDSSAWSEDTESAQCDPTLPGAGGAGGTGGTGGTGATGGATGAAGLNGAGGKNTGGHPPGDPGQTPDEPGDENAGGAAGTDADEETAAEGGCSCRTAGSRPQRDGRSALLLLLGLAAVLRRSRCEAALLHRSTDLPKPHFAFSGYQAATSASPQGR